MDAIGVLLVPSWGSPSCWASHCSADRPGVPAVTSRLAGRVPGGIITGLVLIGIGLLLILIPGGPPAGVPANGPPE